MTHHPIGTRHTDADGKKWTLKRSWATYHCAVCGNWAKGLSWVRTDTLLQGPHSRRFTHQTVNVEEKCQRFIGVD